MSLKYNYKIFLFFALLLLNSFSLSAQQRNVTIGGIIKNPNGELLEGATAYLKGMPQKVVNSDSSGQFIMSVPANRLNDTLAVSLTGYESLDIPLNGQKNLLIELQPLKNTNLNDVVVVAYGTQKKTKVTGAISSITGDQLKTTPSGNITEMLYGKLPGLQVAQVTGEPGDYAASFNIRGFGGALIVIDGVPRDNFDRMDPNEIASISILKDASAAVYGVRSANGVVLITTKKGASGKTKFAASTRFGVATPANTPDVMNAFQWATLTDEYNMNNNSALPYSKDLLDSFKTGVYPSTDWMSLVLRKRAPQSEQNISASGGNDAVKFFISFGHYNEMGLWKSGDLNYQRYNFRSNISARIAKGLEAVVQIGGYGDVKYDPNTSASTIYKSLWMQIPALPIYANNNPEYLNAAIADGTHPLAVTSSKISGYNNNWNKYLYGNFNLNYEIPKVDGLKAHFVFSYNPNYWVNKTWQKAYNLYNYDAQTNTYDEVPTNNPSTLYQTFSESYSTLQQLSLDYTHSFKSKHNISALFVYERRKENGDNFNGSRQFTVDAVDQLYAGNNDQTLFSNGAVTPFTSIGYVGRVNYDYMGKYLLEGSFRYDGSSKFMEGHQWGFFPAGSAGWRISQEDFIKNNRKLDFITDLKLKASYGLMGDDGAADYQWASGYSYPGGANYVFGGSLINGLGYASTANPNITWYTAKTMNLGIEGNLWNGLLSFEMNYFVRKRTGLLGYLSTSIPSQVGASLPQQNLNADLTRGAELVLTTQHKFNKVIFSASGNISISRTKNLYQSQAAPSSDYNNWRNNGAYRWNDIVWGYQAEGQFKSYDEIKSWAIEDGNGNRNLRPGDIKYQDLNGDGIIDGNDRKPIGRINLFPEVNFGLTLSAKWNGFDLNVLFQGATQYQVNYLGTDQLAKPLSWGRNGLDIFWDRWHHEDVTDANSPWVAGYYPSTGSSSSNYQTSTFWLRNASYLRLKSVDIGYTIPLKKIIESARVYFTGYNLMTWSGMNKIIDPEHISGNAGYNYPTMKNYNFGINLNF